MRSRYWYAAYESRPVILLIDDRNNGFKRQTCDCGSRQVIKIGALDMSLDIARLDNEGFPIESISLSADEHWGIMEQVRVRSLPLWGRMSNYYEDADYELDEVVRFADETQILYSNNNDILLKCKLRSVEGILRKAALEHNRVSAIAD